MTKIRRYLGREGASLFFTIAYTLVVLPFTYQFFTSVAHLPEGDFLFGVSLAQTQLAFLPFFLAGLEYSSVRLARAYWRKHEIVALVMFLACQSYAIFSAFYDIRLRDYEQQTTLAQVATASADTQQIRNERTIEREQAEVQSSLAALNTQLQSSDSAIARHRREMSRLRPLLRTTDDSLRYKGLDQQLTREMEVRVRIQEQMLTLSVRDTTSSFPNLPDSSFTPIRRETFYQFMVRRFFAAESIIALFLAMLFPISIMGVTYLMEPGESAPNNMSAFSLDDHLVVGSKLPASAQLGYAQALSASVLMYVTSLRIAKNLNINNTALHLQNENLLGVIEECDRLKEAVGNSDLAPQAKEHLLGQIDNLAVPTFTNPTERFT